MKDHICLARKRIQHSYLLTTILILAKHVKLPRQTLRSKKQILKKINLIVYQITTAITVSCWMLSRIDNEFHGNLRNFKHFYILYNWDLHRKHIGFTKTKQNQICKLVISKLWKIYLCPLWKASTFDSSKRMVVILLVYIKWFFITNFLWSYLSCPKNM